MHQPSDKEWPSDPLLSGQQPSAHWAAQGPDHSRKIWFCLSSLVKRSMRRASSRFGKYIPPYAEFAPFMFGGKGKAIPTEAAEGEVAAAGWQRLGSGLKHHPHR